MEKNAIISQCSRYRYRLTRGWKFPGWPQKTAVFIMLNPSTADAFKDDPTIRRCIGFAQKWKCTDIQVVNLFAFRATHPKYLRKQHEPVGEDNREHVIEAALVAPDMVIAAWGTHGGLMDQDLTVLGWLDQYGIIPHCLGITKNGQPVHPLMQPYSAVLRPYHGRRFQVIDGKNVLEKQHG